MPLIIARATCSQFARIGAAGPARQPCNRDVEKEAQGLNCALEDRRCSSRRLVYSVVAEDTPKNVGELIDRLERIREELHTIQRSLEKLELARPNDDKKSK